MSEAPLTAAELAKGFPEGALDEARKKAVLQLRRLKVESAGPAKATK
jgi:hypothetical protein